MSHFSTIVFAEDPQDVDSLMEPYRETDDPSSLYTEFEPDRDGPFDYNAQQTGYWYNPSGQWDYYISGGYWNGYICPKSQTQFDPNLLPASMADFSFDRALAAKAKREWEVAVEGSPRRDDEFYPYYGHRHYLSRYRSKEKFIEFSGFWVPSAYVDIFGFWHNEGSWTSSFERYSDYRANFYAALKYAIEQNQYIALLDCHI